MPATAPRPKIMGVRSHARTGGLPDEQRLVYEIEGRFAELAGEADGPVLLPLTGREVADELRTGRIRRVPPGGGAVEAAVRGMASGRAGGAGPEALLRAVCPAGVDGVGALASMTESLASDRTLGARRAFAAAVEAEAHRPVPVVPAGDEPAGAPAGTGARPMGADLAGVSSMVLGGGVAAIGAWMSGGLAGLAGAEAAQATPPPGELVLSPLGELVSSALAAALPGSPADLPAPTRAAVLGAESAANVPVAFTSPVEADGVVKLGDKAIARVGDHAATAKGSDMGPITQGNPTVRVTGLPVAGQGHAVATTQGPENVGAPMCLPTVLMGSATATPGAADPSAGGGAPASTGPDSPAPPASAEPGTPEARLAQDAPGQLAESVASHGQQGAASGVQAAQRAAQTGHAQRLAGLDDQIRAIESQRANALVNSTRELLPGESPLIRDAALEGFDRTSAQLDDLRAQRGALGASAPEPAAGASMLGRAVNVATTAMDVIGVIGAWMQEGIDAAADKAVRAGASGLAAGGTAAVVCSPANVAPGAGQLAHGGCIVGAAVAGFAVGAATELGVGYALCKVRVATGMPAGHCAPKP